MPTFTALFVLLIFQLFTKMKFLFYTLLFFITSGSLFSQNRVPLGINFKNGISENLNEWGASKDNVYVMANNTLGEEFMAKLHFYIDGANNKKISLISLDKMPWLRISNGLNYLTAPEILPAFVFDNPVSLKAGGKIHLELVTAKSNEKNVLGHAQINLKNVRGTLRAVEDSKNTYVVAWNADLKPGVSYAMALQGKGTQYGILIDAEGFSKKQGDTVFVNVTKGIPSENYIEVDDANTAYTKDAKFSLDEELYDLLQIIDPDLLESMSSEGSIAKLNTLLVYIEKLKENAEMREMILLVSNDNVMLTKENLKSEQVIETANKDELQRRIKSIYNKIDLLKANIHPSNTLQNNIEHIVMLRDFVAQLIRCKVALKAVEIPSNK